MCTGILMVYFVETRDTQGKAKWVTFPGEPACQQAEP